MSPAPIDNREGLHIVQDGNVSWINRDPKPPQANTEISDAELIAYIRRKDAEFSKPPRGFVCSMVMAAAVLGAVAVVAGIWGLMGCPGVDGFLQIKGPK